VALLVVSHLDHSLHNDIKLETADEALNLLAHLVALLVVPHLDHSLHNDRKLDFLKQRMKLSNFWLTSLDSPLKFPP
jgi:hypothetical protein